MTRASEKGAWLALGLLGAINLMNYYDRLLIVVVSQPIRLEFKLTDTQYGLLSGPVFVFVYAAASLLFGQLADTRNRTRLISLAVALWSAMTALCGMANHFITLALARAGIGVGEGGANPAGMSIISDYFPPKRRPMALAIFQAAGSVGMLASFVLASWISIHFGWRAVFLVSAVPGIALAVAAYLLKWEPERGRFDIAGRGAAGFADSLAGLWKNRAFRGLSIAAAFGVFSSLGMLVWLPQFFIRMHGMDQHAVGFFFGPAAAIGLMGGMVAGGFVGNALARRSLAAPVSLCIAANIALVPVFLTVLWATATWLALGACVAGMALSVIYTGAFQATMQTTCDPAQRGAASAVSNVLNAVVGQGLAPLAVGVLSDRLAPALQEESLRWALTAAVVFPLIAGLLFIGARQHCRKHFQDQALA